jgi:hypothetical protein
MKNILFSCFILLSLVSYSQDGFKLIRRAGKLVEKGKYDRALSFLEQADSANYGFCGNAWWDADREITKLKIHIYNSRNDFYTCVKLLNKGIGFYYFSDSLKMTYLIKLAGKEAIKKELGTFIDNYQYIPSNVIRSMEVSFSFFDEPYSFSALGLTNVIIDVNGNPEEYQNKAFRTAFKNQSFYKLLD